MTQFMFGVRAGALAVLALASLDLRPVLASDCPGHPDAIGTARTLVIDPLAHPLIGGMQYPETLPLHDHEVVLTFDDGPLPKNSDRVLQTLADNCVKATFFLIGEQARAFPGGVRKLVAAGHTIGTHSQTHPLNFEKMAMDKVQSQVDGGIASVTAALSDPGALAPFFRVPGLLRGPNVEQYAASKGLQIWSADFLADDWRHISPGKVYELAIKRLEANRKGILLLHDIQARTATALPKILHRMKELGYRIVQVVPATADRPPTPTDPAEWKKHPDMELASRPSFPMSILAEAERMMMSAKTAAPTEDRSVRLTAASDDQMTAWPSPHGLVLGPYTSAELPVPAQSVFVLPESMGGLEPRSALASVAANVSAKAEAAPGPGYSVAHPARAHRQLRGVRQVSKFGKSGKTPQHADAQQRQARLASLKKHER